MKKKNVRQIEMVRVNVKDSIVLESSIKIGTTGIFIMTFGKMETSLSWKNTSHAFMTCAGLETITRPFLDIFHLLSNQTRCLNNGTLT